MRASLYLLAAALFDEPRPERHEALRALLSSVIYRSPNDARWVPPLMEIADEKDDDAYLQSEYARLFLLAEPRVIAQPYGSYWLEPDGLLMGETTVEIAKLMRAHGIAPAKDAGLLPDHLVCELEFMAFLATQSPNESAHAAQQILLQRHVGAWVPLFLDALRASEPPRHYRMAAHYLQEIITWDRRRWGISPLRHAVAA